MKANHNIYSNLAFNLAETNLGKTKENPSVGCIIVKNKSVISSGVTSINGRPHAEYIALNKDKDFSGSEMYVTLEPCNHYGFTPPCTNLILKKKIKKVFYCFNDPDTRTHRQAKKKLKNKIVKLKKNSFVNFYRSYFLNKTKEFPYINAKIAISKDYFTINKNSKWITNYKSRRIAHLIRSQHDCILSTSETINKDNSLLNCRINGLNHFKPDLIIIDRNLKLKKKLKLYNIAKKRKTYIFTNSNNKKKISFLKKKNIKIIKFSNLENKEDFINLFKKIYKIGKRRILIETGLIFLNKLFNYKLIQELYLFKSGKNLKYNGSNNAKLKYLKKISLNQRIKINLDNDTLHKVRVN